MLCVLSPHRLGLPIASLRSIQTPWSKRRVGEGLPVLSVCERSRKFQIVFRKKKKASLIKQADVRTAPVHVQPGASVTCSKACYNFELLVWPWLFNLHCHSLVCKYLHVVSARFCASGPWSSMGPSCGQQLCLVMHLTVWPVQARCKTAWLQIGRYAVITNTCIHHILSPPLSLTSIKIDQSDWDKTLLCTGGYSDNPVWWTTFQMNCKDYIIKTFPPHMKPIQQRQKDDRHGKCNLFCKQMTA